MQAAQLKGFPDSASGKESACQVGDWGSIPRLGRYPGGGHGNPLQYSCLENPRQGSLARLPWTEEPGGLQSMGSQRVGHGWSIWTQDSTDQLKWAKDLNGQLSKENAQMANKHTKRYSTLLVKSLSHIRLFATSWTVAYQAPLSMGFSRQEYWSGLSLPSPGDLPDPGIEPGSPALQTEALPSETPRKPFNIVSYHINVNKNHNEICCDKKRQIIKKYCQECGEMGALIHCWWKCKMASYFKKQSCSSLKLIHEVAVWSSNSSLKYLLIH